MAQDEIQMFELEAYGIVVLEVDIDNAKNVLDAKNFAEGLDTRFSTLLLASQLIGVPVHPGKTGTRPLRVLARRCLAGR